MDRKSSVTIDLLRLGVMDTDAASANHHRIAENIGADPNRLADWEHHLETCCDPDLASTSLLNLHRTPRSASAKCSIMTLPPAGWFVSWAHPVNWAATLLPTLTTSRRSSAIRFALVTTRSVTICLRS